MQKHKTFARYMQQLAHRNSISTVFSDFLEMAVCALSMGAMEDRYLEIVRRYDKPEVYLMAEAFGALVIEMDDHGEGLKDVFGDFFMEHISFGQNGQFFTPEPICELMARMTDPIESGSRILDCACGSGRTLLAAARINRDATFYGADVDRNCAMMCVINFCLNGMFGEVAWMNSLTNEFYGAWQVRPYPVYGNPYIVPITEAESQILLKLPENKAKEVKPKPDPVFTEIKPDLFDEILSPANSQQLKLF